jgi:hypothetical protein
MVHTWAESKSLHTWIKFVIVKQYLVPIGPTDGPTDFLSQILAAIRFPELLPKNGTAGHYTASLKISPKSKTSDRQGALRAPSPATYCRASAT